MDFELVVAAHRQLFAVLKDVQNHPLRSQFVRVYVKLDVKLVFCGKEDKRWLEGCFLQQ